MNDRTREDLTKKATLLILPGSAWPVNNSLYSILLDSSAYLGLKYIIYKVTNRNKLQDYLKNLVEIKIKPSANFC